MYILYRSWSHIISIHAHVYTDIIICVYYTYHVHTHTHYIQRHIHKYRYMRVLVLVCYPYYHEYMITASVTYTRGSGIFSLPFYSRYRRFFFLSLFTTGNLADLVIQNIKKYWNKKKEKKLLRDRFTRDFRHCLNIINEPVKPHWCSVILTRTDVFFIIVWLTYLFAK